VSRLSDPNRAEEDAFRCQYMRRLVLENSAPASRLTASAIPKVIVQFWHDSEEIPADVRGCLDSWEPLVDHGFERAFFDDRSARLFISRRFGRHYLEAFERCGHAAMRCDFFRMCYLVALGGVYVDADELYQGGAWEPLFRDNLLKLQPLCYDSATGAMVKADVFARGDISSPEWIYYVNNNPIITPPGHPILRLALARSTRILMDHPTERLEIQSTTGPGNLTTSLVAHAIASEGTGAVRDFALLTDWDSLSVSQWPLSYRNDERNWRLWDPSK
jgi:mannosyltransferase OCH1-like enzyme